MKNKQGKDGLPLLAKILIVILGFIFLLLISTLNIGNLDIAKKDNDTSSLNSTTTTIKFKEKSEEIKDTIESTLMGDHPIEKLNKNDATGKYIIEVLYKKSSLSISICADDTKYLAKKFVKDSDIESLQFKCENSDGVIGYVKVENLSNISEDKINDNTTYYDSSMKKKSLSELEKIFEKKYKDSCDKFKYKDVLRTPSDYEGKNAYWFGKVVQVVGSYEYRISVNCEKNRYAVGGYICDDPIYVSYYGDLNLLEDDVVKMYGVMEGTETYTTVLGASVTIPKFYAKYVELVG